MTKLDTYGENYSQIEATPTDLDIDVDQSMDDHDLLLHHVAQYDHELYALDCCMGELKAI